MTQIADTFRRAQAEAVVDMLNSATKVFTDKAKQREYEIELVEAALAATPAKAAGGWRLIDGDDPAPKDGTEILLYGPGVLIMDGRSSIYARAPHVGWWFSGFWATRDPMVTCRATHWMPIAASPSPDGERQEGDGA